MKTPRINLNRLWDLAAGRLPEDDTFLLRRQVMESASLSREFDETRRAVRATNGLRETLDADVPTIDDAWAAMEARLNVESFTSSRQRNRMFRRWSLRAIATPLVLVLFIAGAAAAVLVVNHTINAEKSDTSPEVGSSAPVKQTTLDPTPDPELPAARVVTVNGDCAFALPASGEIFKTNACSVHIQWGSDAHLLLEKGSQARFTKGDEALHIELTQGEGRFLFDGVPFAVEAGQRTFTGVDGLFTVAVGNKSQVVSVVSGRVGVRSGSGDLRHLLLGPQRWEASENGERLGLPDRGEKENLLTFAALARHGYETQPEEDAAACAPTVSENQPAVPAPTQAPPVANASSTPRPSAPVVAEPQGPDPAKLYREGRYGEALAVLTGQGEGLSFDQSYLHGLVLTALGKHEQAVRAFQRAERCRSAEVASRSLYEQARLLADRLSRPVEAERLFRRYLQRYPNGLLTQDVLVRLCERALRTGTSTSACTRYLAEYPDGFRAPGLHWALAKRAVASQDHQTAAAHLLSVKETLLAPGDREAYRYLKVFCSAQLGKRLQGLKAARVYLSHHATGPHAEQVRALLGRWEAELED